MVELKDYLAERGYTLLRRLNHKANSQIALAARPDGTKRVCRLYDHTVCGYRAAAQLDLPELPRVFLCKETDGCTVVEEEYVDGLPLSELLDCHLTDESQTAAIAMHICAALGALHGMGVIHRDVKPENVLVTSAGRVVLIDLDAAAGYDPEKERDTRLLGTVGYAAPEQFGFARSDARTDIFGLGVMMNEMLAGEHPANGLAGGALLPVIEKCIEVNADKRYRSVSELSGQLRGVRGKDAVCSVCGFTSPGGGCIFCGTPAKRVRRLRRRTACVLAAAAAALLCGVLLLRFLPGGEAAEDAAPPLLDAAPEPVQRGGGQSLPEEDAPAAPAEPEQEPPDVPEEPAAPEEPAEEPEAVAEEPEEPSEEPAEEPEEPETAYPPVAYATDQPEIQKTITAYTGTVDCTPVPFSYDADQDGTPEQYYLGVLRGESDLRPYSAYSYLPDERFELPYESDGEMTGTLSRTVAPAAFVRHEDGSYILAEEFPLSEPEITFYYSPDTVPASMPTLRESVALLGAWGHAETVTFDENCAGIWVIRCAITLYGVEYAAVCTTEIVKYRPTYVLADAQAKLSVLADSPEMFRIALDAGKTQLCDGSYRYSCDEGLGRVYWSPDGDCVCLDASGAAPGTSGKLYVTAPNGTQYALAVEIGAAEHTGTNVAGSPAGHTESCTPGVPVGSAVSLPFTTQSMDGSITMYGITIQLLDNDHVRFCVDYTAPAGGKLLVFHPPGGQLYRQEFDYTISGARERACFDVPLAYILEQEELTGTFYQYPNGQKFFYLRMEDVRELLSLT